MRYGLLDTETTSETSEGITYAAAAKGKPNKPLNVEATPQAPLSAPGAATRTSAWETVSAGPSGAARTGNALGGDVGEDHREPDAIMVTYLDDTLLASKPKAT